MRYWGLFTILFIFENHQIIGSNDDKILKIEKTDSEGENTESEKKNDVVQEKGNEASKNITESVEKKHKKLNLKNKIRKIQGALEEFVKKLMHALQNIASCGGLTESYERERQEKKDFDQLQKQKTGPYYYNDYYYVNDPYWEPCEIE